MDRVKHDEEDRRLKITDNESDKKRVGRRRVNKDVVLKGLFENSINEYINQRYSPSKSKVGNFNDSARKELTQYLARHTIDLLTASNRIAKGKNHGAENFEVTRNHATAAISTSGHGERKSLKHKCAWFLNGVAFAAVGAFLSHVSTNYSATYQFQTDILAILYICVTLVLFAISYGISRD